jgi:hypothetical protein
MTIRGTNESPKERHRRKAREWAKNNKERALANSKRWQEANPERIKELKKAWKKRNPDSVRETRWRNIGIKGATVELYDQLLKEQGGVCGICGRLPKKRRLAFDHNHKHHFPRGLLCTRCNILLGVFEKSFSNPYKVEAIFSYLKRYHTPSDPL